MNTLFSIIIFVITIFSIFVFNRRRKPINLPPGPPRLPIIGNLTLLNSRPQSTLHQLCKKYGPITYLKLGTENLYVISNPEFARLAFKTYDLDTCSRPVCECAKRITYNFCSMSLTSYSEHWRQMRRICTIEVFNTEKLKSTAFDKIRSRSATDLVNEISRSIPNAVNLSEKIFDFVGNIMCEVAMGKYYAGKQFGDVTLEEAICLGTSMLGGIMVSQFMPYVGWMVDCVTGIYQKREKVFRLYDGFLTKVVDEHFDLNRPTPERRDLVDALIEFTKDQPGYTKSHIKAILVDMLLGGIETTALTTTAAMIELMKCPRALKRAQEEIRNAVGKTDKTHIDNKTCDNLKYLKMVVKETLRLRPPAVFLLPHKSMHHFKMGSYDILPNSTVIVNIGALARDQSSWDNPEEFIPERFEKDNLDYGGQNFEYLPFGSGRRMCPGLHMGSTHVGMAIGNLLYFFDWELPDGVTTDTLGIEEEVGLALHMKEPLRLIPKKHVW